MDQIVLACPYCTGRIEVEPAPESRAINCPHCNRPVTVPAVPRQPSSPPPPPPPPTLPTTPAEPRARFAEPTKTVLNRRGEPVPLRRLTPDERQRFRRRLSWACALIGMAILAIALAVLLRLRP